MAAQLKALRYLCDDLRRQPRDANAWMFGNKLYNLLHSCLHIVGRRQRSGYEFEANGRDPRL